MTFRTAPRSGFNGFSADAELAERVNALWEAQEDHPDTLPALAEQTLAEAQGKGDTRAQFWIYATRTLFMYRERPMAQSRADLEAAQRLLPLVDDERAPHLLAICQALLGMAAGPIEQAYSLYSALPLRSSNARDDPDDFFILQGRALTAARLGKLEEAFQAFYANLQLTHRLGLPMRHCLTACYLTWLLCDVGSVGEGIELLQPLIEQWMDPARHCLLWAVSMQTLAMCKYQHGQKQGAYDDLLALLGANVLTRFPSFGFSIYESLAELALKLGRLDDASRYLGLAYERANGNDAWLGACHLHAAELAQAQGNLTRSIELLEQAQTCLDKDPDITISSATRRDVAEALAQRYVETENYRLAFEAQKRFFDAYKLRADYMARGKLAALRVRHGLTVALHQLEAERAFALARERKLHQQARKDGLTGLYNRRYLDEALPELLTVAGRERVQLAIAMIDLDHFKRVNDTYGHAGGDAVLRAFAQIASSSVRESDIACRYGGEEFCIVLLGCDRRDAVERLLDMLANFQRTRVEQGSQVIEGLSFSCGVAMYPADGDNPTDLLVSGDQRLYAAKQAGRRQVRATT